MAYREDEGRENRNLYPQRKKNTALRSRKKSSMQREKKKVHRDVFLTGAVVLAMFISLIIYTCVYSATQEQALFENDYNGREAALLAKNTRGKIYADDGTTELALSTDTKVDSSQDASTESVAEDSSTGDSEEAAAQLSDDAATREYPYNNLFSHVVGYAAEGGSGIELAYNYQLVHSDLTLAEKAVYDSAGEKYPSDDVYTTLNVALQQAASDALGDNKGAVIVTDVKTGAILCMVSKPDFDPNTIEENWDTLLADSDSGTLVNRVSQGLYAPGSTFKIFDSIEFMTENMEAAESYSFPCQGYITIDGETITDYHYEKHGTLDFEGSFAESCNSSFANIVVNELNRTSFASLLDNCMFGEDLPFELPSNKSSYVLDAGTSTKEVMQLAIGQGQTLMSPLHLNMITAAIANGGTVYTPYVVSSVRTAKTDQNPDGKVLTETTPTAYRTIMSEDVAAKMREMMRAVVEYGTATKIRERSYNAAGKTGSAEYMSNDTTSHAWFTGFAPYDDPQVAITVIVEGGGTGGTAAVPIARDVLDEYFGYTGSEADQQVTWYTTDNTIAPASTSDEDENLNTDNTIALNMDTNGDGILDAVDIDGDGVADVYDTDGDGIPDTQAINGQAPAIVTPDEASTAASSTDENAQTADTTNWVDTDGDGVPDTPPDEAAAAASTTTDASQAASTATTDAASAASSAADADAAASAASSAASDAAAEQPAADAGAAAQDASAQQTPTVTDPNQAPAAGDGTAQDAAAAAQAEALPTQ